MCGKGGGVVPIGITKGSMRGITLQMLYKAFEPGRFVMLAALLKAHHRAW
jgi:hypothetical protein